MPFRPKVWGPPFWEVLHIGAYRCDLLYPRDPTKAQDVFKTLVLGIQKGLPCPQCEHHFEKFQQNNPLPSQSGGYDDPTFLKYTIKAHNQVNLRNNKYTPTEDEVIQSYRSGQLFKSSSSSGSSSLSSSPPSPSSALRSASPSPCSKNKIPLIVLSVIIVILLIIIVIQFINRNK